MTLSKLERVNLEDRVHAAEYVLKADYAALQWSNTPEQKAAVRFRAAALFGEAVGIVEPAGTPLAFKSPATSRSTGH